MSGRVPSTRSSNKRWQDFPSSLWLEVGMYLLPAERWQLSRTCWRLRGHPMQMGRTNLMPPGIFYRFRSRLPQLLIVSTREMVHHFEYVARQHGIKIEPYNGEDVPIWSDGLHEYLSFVDGVLRALPPHLWPLVQCDSLELLGQRDDLLWRAMTLNRWDMSHVNVKWVTDCAMLTKFIRSGFPWWSKASQFPPWHIMVQVFNETGSLLNTPIKSNMTQEIITFVNHALPELIQWDPTFWNNAVWTVGVLSLETREFVLQAVKPSNSAYLEMLPSLRKRKEKLREAYTVFCKQVEETKGEAWRDKSKEWLGE